MNSALSRESDAFWKSQIPRARQAPVAATAQPLRRDIYAVAFARPGWTAAMKRSLGVLPLGALEVPRALEEDERPPFEVHEAGDARRIVEALAVEALALHPARERERQADVRDLGAVLRREGGAG